MSEELRFVKLSTNGKGSITKYKDGQGLSWKEVADAKKCPDIGLVIPQGYTIVDVDDTKEAEKLFKLVKDLHIKTKVMKTTKGYHFWFKADMEEPCRTAWYTAIGVTIDIKNGFRNSYTVIRRNGINRKWVYRNDSEGLEFRPNWLKPLELTSKVKCNVSQLKSGERNDSLFKYMSYLVSHEYEYHEIRQIYSLINDYILDKPLGQNEIDTISRKENFDNALEFCEKRSFLNDKGVLVPALFGDLMIKKYNPITLTKAENIYIFRNGFYKEAEQKILQDMIHEYKYITIAQRREVLDYMKKMTFVEKDDISTKDYIVNTKSGRLNLRDGKCSPLSPEHYDLKQLPVYYDEDAYDEQLDLFLNRIFCNDLEIRALFEEFMGYSLYNSNRYGKMIFFLGGGSNGKSTLLNFMSSFFGEQNKASLKLKDFGDKFKLPDLQDKMINIGDEIDSSTLSLTATFKTLVTGEPITVERKNQQPFSMENRAKIVFTCNTMPYIQDDTYAIERRVIVIPMLATFTENDADFDPFILEKIVSDNAKSYMLNLAIKGIQRVFERNRFTMPKVVNNTLNNLKIVHSGTLQWINGRAITTQWLIDKPLTEIYDNFEHYLVTILKKNKRYIPNMISFKDQILKNWKHLDFVYEDASIETGSFICNNEELLNKKLIDIL